MAASATPFASFTSPSTQFIASKLPTNRSLSYLPSPPQFRRPLLRISARASTTTSESGCYNIAAAPSSTPSSLYEVLGIHMGASRQEIKAAYRRLARTLHPDVNGEKENTTCEFIRVNEAYQTLSDPAKRADYDRRLLVRQGRPLTSSFVMSATAAAPMSSSAASGFSGYTRRRWESDQCW
ncbi:hypothetical protein Tsubulata_044193 [Turnera subulata]|uniref:J domain-containing protein n=1 Tax=Turnera subulata TaxID=218843 RepID=A0A9Q0FA41_9ROSI|nr:hypothetical protein Tsubulata_044193 [Turnera subulata]